MGLSRNRGGGGVERPTQPKKASMFLKICCARLLRANLLLMSINKLLGSPRYPMFAITIRSHMRLLRSERRRVAMVPEVFTKWNIIRMPKL